MVAKDTGDVFVSTYAQLIIIGCLGKFAVNMDAAAMYDQLNRSGPFTFYKKYFSPKSSEEINNIYLNQLRDICEYIEPALSQMMYAIDEISPSQFQSELNSLRQYVEENRTNFQKAFEQQAIKNRELETEAQIRIPAWKKLQEQHADQIIAKLTVAGIAVPTDFKNRLIQLLDLQGAGVKISAAILGIIKLPSKSQKAFIGAMNEPDLMRALNAVQEELRQIEKTNEIFINSNTGVFNRIHQENKSFTKNVIAPQREQAQILMTAIDKFKERLPTTAREKMETTQVTSKPTISPLKISHT